MGKRAAPKKSKKAAKARKPSKRRSVTEPLFDEDQVIDAFYQAMGCVAQAARSLDCNRATLFLYCKNYPRVQKALDEARASYKETCQSFARDNHLHQLMEGGSAATAYELEKMEPKADGAYLDLSKLTPDEAIILHRLLQKAKPDGSGEKAA